MEQKKEDRRTSRTRRLLKDALFALILEQGYDAVTIEDITERADLGRTTFYLHYRDKEQLFLESIDAIAEDLVEQIAHLNGVFAGGDRLRLPADMEPGIPILLVFRHAADNARLYRILLRGEGGPKATRRFTQIISDLSGEYIQNRIAAAGGNITPLIPLNLFSSYLAGAILTLITWWLENDLPYTPEDMAGMFQRLFFQGTRHALGLPPIE
jgi:AcrR family transcriptional regulator